ncbi:MAG: ROK family protein [Bacilli bacterium]|jgi:glucokinase
MSRKAIGIDIGGTTTKAAVVDETGAISYIKEIKTPQNNELGFFRELNNLIENALHHEPEVVALGIGAPGSVTPSTTFVHVLHNLGYRAIDFNEKINEHFNLPIFVANDANVAAYAEALLGSGKDYNVVQYITLSTGVGGGLIINKEMYTGTHGFAQEVGNMIIDGEAPKPNPTMNANSFEACCSGAGLFNAAKRFAPSIQSIASIFSDSRFSPIKNIWLDNLGKALANLYALYEPDVIILGGGIMNSADKFFDAIVPNVKKYTFTELHPYINIKRATFGPRAGVIGAALFALNKVNQ